MPSSLFLKQTVLQFHTFSSTSTAFLSRTDNTHPRMYCCISHYQTTPSVKHFHNTEIQTSGTLPSTTIHRVAQCFFQTSPLVYKLHRVVLYSCLLRVHSGSFLAYLLLHACVHQPAATQGTNDKSCRLKFQSGSWKQQLQFMMPKGMHECHNSGLQ